MGPAGLSAYHAAWQAADASGPRLVGLQLVDGSVVLQEASLIVEGDHIAGPITSSRISPTPRPSICPAQVNVRLARPGTEVTERLPSERPIAGMIMPQLANSYPAIWQRRWIPSPALERSALAPEPCKRMR